MATTIATTKADPAPLFDADDRRRLTTLDYHGRAAKAALLDQAEAKYAALMNRRAITPDMILTLKRVAERVASVDKVAKAILNIADVLTDYIEVAA